MTVRVVVVDDHALIRGSFRLLVDSAPDLLVVGEAATGAEAVDVTRRTRPDVVLMDIRMPDMDGIEATRLITGVQPDTPTRILVLTTFDLDDYVFGALRAGASGFLLKEASPADLLAAIRVIAAGDALIAPRVTRRLIEEYVRSPDPTRTLSRDLADVTEREREVLVLVGQGLTNNEIAGALHISLATAKTHVSRLLSKLNARDRTQLVIAAYENGLIQPR